MTKVEIEKKYKLKDSLIRIKLLQYIPVLVISQLSTMLILSVDSIIVSNYVGQEALAAVQIFHPVTAFLGVITAIISNGTAHCLSARIVKNDFENLKYVKAAILKIIKYSVFIVAIIQIPIVFGILKSYHLEPTMYAMTKDYAIGIMFSLPFSIISAVSVCQLQTSGKMKVLMCLSLIEGAINLSLDLLFVKKLNMGVVGAGFGSAIASVTRSLLTLAYVHFKTDTYKNIDVKARMEDIKEIIKTGLPEATSILVNSIQGYIMVRLLLHAFDGSTGATIKGVCAFCYSIANVAIASVQGSMRPLINIMNGADDKKGLYHSMMIAFRNLMIVVGVISIIMQIYPAMFYHLHGIKEIPKYGIESLRFYVVFFILSGINSIYRLYFVIKGHAKYTAILTLIVNTTLPLFAFALFKIFSPPHLWLAYTITAVLVFIPNTIKYIKSVKKDNNTTDEGDTIYITVTPEDASNAAKDIEEYAKNEGYSPTIATNIATCLEKMVSSAVKSQNNLFLHLQIIITFFDNNAKFVMLDDGICIRLDEDEDKHDIISNNYANIKKIVKSYNYQYILNMNYTTLNFEA